MATTTSTLAASESRWAPTVWATLVVCLAAGAILLAASHGAAPAWAWWPACLVWAALSGSNVLFVVQHRHTTVGMLPVSIASVAPGAFAVLWVGTLRLVGVALLVPSLAVWVFVAQWFCRLRNVYSPALTPADDCVVIVLGGAVANGQPSRTLRSRLDVAYRLCAHMPQRTLILTGGATADGPTEADVMAAYLRARGIAPAQMLLETHARNTAENIGLSCELARMHGLDMRQLSVITSDYHLYRAVAEGRRQGVELLPIPAATPPASRLQQWCREVATIVSKG